MLDTPKRFVISGVISAALALALAVGCGGAAAGAGAPDLAGAQKASPQGAKVYSAECAGCHGKNGEGIGTAPPVMGGSALPKVHAGRPEFKSAADVFAYVKSSMPLPEKRVGSLSDDQYWAVTSYMLAASGKQVPAGGLTPDNAGGVVVHP
jgi:mono/diheme cytochrome c family protein